MLESGNIVVGGRRTSIRLEPEFWSVLRFIADAEGISLDQLITEIDGGSGNLSRTAAVRLFIVEYTKVLSGAKRANRAAYTAQENLHSAGGSELEKSDRSQTAA